MELKWNKQTFILCLFIFASTLPAVFLRELSPINELNYIAAAQDAIDNNHFFSFFEDGKPYTQTPPFYMWICMIAILFDGLPTSSIMLFLNVFSLMGIIYLLDQTFGSMLQRNYRYKTTIIIISMPFMLTATLLAQPIVLFALLVVASTCFIKSRTDEIIEDPDQKIETGNIAIPLLIFLSIFTNGLLGLLIPLFTLFLVLFTLKKLKLYFLILPPRYFYIIAIFYFIWVSLTLSEAGVDYSFRMFIYEPYARLIGLSSLGSSQSIAYYFIAFWILSLPLGISAAYAGVKIFLSEKRKIALSPLFAIAMPLATLIIISIPSSKNVTYVFASLPTIAYFMVYYNQKYGTRDRVLKILFALGMLPFGLLFFAYFYVKEQFPCLKSIYVISSLLFLMLFSALAIFKVSRSSATEGVATFGVGMLVMTFTVGFAMPEINASVSYSLVGEALDRKMEDSNNFNLCYMGINNPWTLKLYNKDMNLKLSDKENINLDYCKNNFRIIGRSALRDHEDLNKLKSLKNARMYGDTLLISPEQTKEQK